MENTNEASLIQRCKDGQQQAFDEFALKYYKKVLNVAYRLMNDYDEANDITQDVFIRAFRGIGNFRQEAAVFTWLYRITINLCKNRLKVLNRQRKKIESLDDPVPTEEGEIKRELAHGGPIPSQILIDKDINAQINKALSSLKSEFGEAVALRDIEGLSYQEIAQILRINIGTVKSRLHRGRMILREKLQGVLR